MKRSPQPSLHASLFPALVTLLAAGCDRSQPATPGQHAANPAGGPTVAHAPDAAPAPSHLPLQPARIDPAHAPSSAMGALRTVTAMPAAVPGEPPPNPSPEMLATLGRSPELMGRPAGVYVVHEHPVGAPCTPISQRELQAALPH